MKQHKQYYQPVHAIPRGDTLIFLFGLSAAHHFMNLISQMCPHQYLCSQIPCKDTPAKVPMQETKLTKSINSKKNVCQIFHIILFFSMFKIKFQHSHPHNHPSQITPRLLFGIPLPFYRSHDLNNILYYLIKFSPHNHALSHVRLKLEQERG